MSVRLIITLFAEPGKGGDLAAEFKTRCAWFREEPGCEQFDAYQGIDDPDTVILLERWVDQAALDAHAKLNATRPPLPPGLRKGAGEREDYVYNRVR